MEDEKGPRALCDKFHPGSGMLLAYVPCWPWEAEMCDQCGEIVTYWGAVKQAIWDVLIGWWWNGAVMASYRPFPAEKRKA